MSDLLEYGENKIHRDLNKSRNRIKDLLLKNSNKSIKQISKLSIPKKWDTDLTAGIMDSLRKTGQRSMKEILSQINSETRAHNRDQKDISKRFPETKQDEEWDLLFEEGLEFQESRVFISAGVTNKELLDRGKMTMIQAIQEGSTPRDIRKHLKEVFPKYSQNRLDTIARTNSATAANLGRLSVMKESPAVKGMEYNAILDERTTPFCEGMDGQFIARGDALLERINPPNHYMCRSYLVPVMEWNWDKATYDGRLTPWMDFRTPLLPANT